MSLRTRFRDVLALARDFGEFRIAERLPVEGDLALGEVVFEPPDAQGRLTEARGTALQWTEGQDRNSGVSGKRWSAHVNAGVRRTIQKTTYSTNEIRSDTSKKQT